MSEPTPPKLHEIAHKVCLAYGITYTGWPAELVDPAACEGSITWGLEQAFKLGRHVDDALFKLQADALRLRVEELTHERDTLKKTMASKEWLAKLKHVTYSDQKWRDINAELHLELGEARQARWIPVSESIPEVFRRCLTWHEPKAGCCRGVQISTFYEDGWAEVHDCAPSYDQPKLTHWMPLPEPPK